jgi:hypothetical protein
MQVDTKKMARAQELRAQKVALESELEELRAAGQRKTPRANELIGLTAVRRDLYWLIEPEYAAQVYPR